MVDTVRKHFRFVGHVQGVGMRYLCAKLAEEQGCTGWVYNELDGSVHAEFQGEDSAIETLLAALDEHYNGTPWLGGFDIDRSEELEPMAGEAAFEIH